MRIRLSNCDVSGSVDQVWTLDRGYEDVVIHVSLLQVVCDGVLVDFGQQHHVVHAAHLHVLSLPMVTLLTALWGEGHKHKESGLV